MIEFVDKIKGRPMVSARAHGHRWRAPLHVMAFGSGLQGFMGLRKNFFYFLDK